MSHARGVFFLVGTMLLAMVSGCGFVSVPASPQSAVPDGVTTAARHTPDVSDMSRIAGEAVAESSAIRAGRVRTVGPTIGAVLISKTAVTEPVSTATDTPILPTATPTPEVIAAESLVSHPGADGAGGAAQGLISVDESQWKVLYRRDGWQAGHAVDLRAVGDIMLGRTVGRIARENGLEYTFAQVHDTLDGDLTIGNLEGPLTNQGPANPGEFTLFGQPEFAEELRAVGFDALSLANNHGQDVGPPGLGDAVVALRAAGITPYGAGEDAAQAYAPAMLESGGLRVAVLGFNDVPAHPRDSGETWGRASLDEDALEAVRLARQEADIVIVMPHWGEEYTAEPSARQREWAALLVEAGADLIVGAHPHWVETAELVQTETRSGYVAYSLGNFVFDQAWSRRTGIGAALRVLLDADGVALVAAAPIEIVRTQPQPVALDSSIGIEALELLQAPSERPALAGWSWDGSASADVSPPGDLPIPTLTRSLTVDLRGDGQPLLATLDERGLLEVHEGVEIESAVLWRNEGPDWFVSDMDVGDPDDEGYSELLFVLWKPGADGSLESHPVVLGWRDGAPRIFWSGTAPRSSIQALAIGDLDGDQRSELALLQGGDAPGALAESVSIWHWDGSGFGIQWRSEVGTWRGLWLQDIDGDERPELIASGAYQDAGESTLATDASGASIQIPSGFVALSPVRTFIADSAGICARSAAETAGVACPEGRRVLGDTRITVFGSGAGESLVGLDGTQTDVWFYGETTLANGEVVQGYFFSGVMQEENP